MPRINSPRMFSSKNTIDKMAMETGLEEKSKIKCAKKLLKLLVKKLNLWHQKATLMIYGKS